MSKILNPKKGHELYCHYRNTYTDEALQALIDHYFFIQSGKLTAIVYSNDFSTLDADRVIGQFTDDMIKRLQREKSQPYQYINNFDNYFYSSLIKACDKIKKKIKNTVDILENQHHLAVRSKGEDKLGLTDIWNTLSSFPEVTIQIVKMREKGFKKMEIAKELGLSYGKVSRQLNKVKIHLQNYK